MRWAVSPEQVAQVFAALGRIEQKVEDTKSSLVQHAQDDKAMAVDIRTIQLRLAKQRGFMTALTSVGSVVGAGVGYLVERWITGGSH